MILEEKYCFLNIVVEIVNLCLSLKVSKKQQML